MNDPVKNVEKGAKAAGVSVAMVLLFAAGDALARWLSDPESVSLVLAQYPHLLWAVPLLTGAAAAYVNYRKHRETWE